MSATKGLISRYDKIIEYLKLNGPKDYAADLEDLKIKHIKANATIDGMLMISNTTEVTVNIVKETIEEAKND